jgi:hypothetical protein
MVCTFAPKLLVDVAIHYSAPAGKKFLMFALPDLF